MKANANVKIKAVLEEKRLENREKVLSKKEEIKQRIIIKKQEQAVTLKQKAQLVEFIKEQKSKVHLAVDKVQEVNREVVVKAKEERVKRKKQLEKEKEEEMKKKKEFIQKIQALEKLAGVRGKRPTEFDPTQSSGLGLLDEMSLVELHERLNLLKLEYKDQEERKRKAIQEDRKQKAR